MDTPLAKIWLQKAINYPNITLSLNRKYLNQLLLLNITTLDQITLPNQTSIMNEKEFQKYHKKPTLTIKLHHKIKSPQNCITPILYTNECNPLCSIYIQSYTLAPEIINQLNQNFFYNPLPKNNLQANIQELPKPPK
jgi:hypothetical protein